MNKLLKNVLRALPIVVAGMFISLPATAQQPIQFGKLFRTDKLLKLKIKYDIKTLQENKEALRETGILGTLDLENKSLEVLIHPRGAGSFDCTQPQVKINFSKSETALTPFAGFKKIKLFTAGICLDNTTSQHSDKVVLANYLNYKLTEKFFDVHFKTRLVDITYQDTSGKYPAYRQLAFLLEPEKHLEQRLGATRLEQEIIDANQNPALAKQILEGYDKELINKADAFEFLIGNFDYGVPGIYSHIIGNSYWVEKNIHLYQYPSGKIIPLLFDFDFSRLSYRTEIGCYIAVPFFLNEPYDTSVIAGKCDVVKMRGIYSADLKKFRYANSVVDYKAKFLQALNSWRSENKYALKKLGANYEAQLDAFAAAAAQAF